MPRSMVDEQVVKMLFDNSNFDSNIDDSIKSLNKLDYKINALQKDNAFNSIANGMNSLANVFTIKGQIMLGVLTRIGNKIADIGQKAFGAFFNGIRDGLREYDLLIESTQTIYENVKQNGKNLDDVNYALDTLNDYADKTIYNFSEMTRMIGMFTSAGVDLDKSVSTIKGLANAAALVGANSQKAEMAWRAVSRAMSSGRFTLLTWKTLEQSNIAGKQFQVVIKDVAKNHGINIDKMIKKEGSFRDTLKKGWLTKDLFAEAMQIMSGELAAEDLRKKKYSEAQIKELMSIAKSAEEAATRVKSFKQLMSTTAEAIGSGWAQSFRILIGDLEQARKFYTRISETLNAFIDNNAEIRNKLFKEIINGEDGEILGKWRSGRDNLTQIVENMTATIITFLKSVQTAFLNIFPADRISSAARKVLDVFQKFTRIFVINASEIDESGNKIWNTKDIDKMTESIKDLIRFFRGLFAILDIIWMAISQPLKVIINRIPFFNNFFKNSEKSIKGLINGLGKIGDKITVFRDAVKNSNLFGAALAYIFNNFEDLVEKSPFLYVIVEVFKAIKTAIINVKNAFNGLEIKPLTTIFGLFKFVITAAWKALNNLFELIKNVSIKVDWSWLDGPKQAIKDLLKLFDAYGQGLITFEDVTKKVSDYFKTFWSNIKEYVNSVPFFDTFRKIFNTIKSITSSIIDVIKKFFGSFKKEVGDNNSKIVTNLEKADEAFSNIETTVNKVESTVNNLSNGIDSVSSGVKELTDNVLKLDLSEITKSKTGFGILDALENSGNLTNDTIDSISDSIKGNVSKNIDEISNAAEEEIAKNKKNLFSGTIGKIKDFIKSISDVFTKNSSNISNSIDSICKKVLLFGGGLALISIGIKKIVRTFQSIRVVANLNNLLTAGVDVIRAYQKEIQTKAILNVALAIGILAVSMAALSFIPYDRLEKGFVIFASFLGVLAITITPVVKALAKLNEAMSKNAKVLTKYDVLNNAVKTFGKFSKKIAKGINARMIGKMFKDIAIAVLILVAAMIALKIAFKKPEDIIMPLAAIAVTIAIMTAAIGGLILIMDAFIKSAKDLKPSVGIFGSFFKMAGVSKIIISIAVAVGILVAAIIMLSKVPSSEALSAFVMVGALLAILGVIAGKIAAVSQITTSDQKIKRVTLSITGALLGIAVVLAVVKSIGDPVQMAIALGGIVLILSAIAVIIGLISKLKIPANMDRLTSLVLSVTLAIAAIAASVGALVVIIANSGKGSWIGPLALMTTIFGAFSALLIVLLSLALKINQKTTIWNNLNKISTMIAMIAGAILTIAASIAILGNTPPIDGSVYSVLIGISAAIAIILVVAYKLANSKVNNKFIKTVQHISILIASIVSSFALVLLGIAALTYAVNQLSIPSKDFNKAAKTVVDKIASVVNIIALALPQLARLFGKLGKQAGELFVSFISAFVDSVVGMSETWLELADVVVGAVLDLLEKVVDKLYERKDTIASILTKLISLLSTVFTSVLNAFFSRGTGLIFTEAALSKWLGIGTVLALVGTFAEKIVKIAKGLWIVISPIFKGIGKLYANLYTYLATATGASKAAVIADLAAISIAVTAAGAAIGVLIKGVSVGIKGETDALNANVQDAGDVLSDSTSAWYAVLFGAAKVGRTVIAGIIDTVLLIPRVVASSLLRMMAGISYAGSWIYDKLGKMQQYLLKNEYLANLMYNTSKEFDLSGDFAGEDAEKILNSLTAGIKDALNDDNITIFGADENWFLKQGKTNTEAYTAGALAGLDEYYEQVSGKLSKDNAKIITDVKHQLGIASPSKVFASIYRNVMLGALEGYEKGSKEYKKQVKAIDKTYIQEAKNTALALSTIMEKLGLAKAETAYKYGQTIKDFNTGEEKYVELNKEVIKTIDEETKALKGKTRQEAIDYVTSKLITERKAADIKNFDQAVANGIDAVFAMQDNKTRIATQGLENFATSTKATIQEVFGNEMAAAHLVVEDAYNNYFEITKLAEDHKNELVGKKKEEVKEILYQAALERGMTEEQAKESVDAVVDTMFKGKKDKATITEAELQNKLNAFATEFDKFKETEVLKTSILQEAEKERTEIEKEAAKKRTALQALEAKKQAEINAYTWNYQKEQDYINQKAKIEKDFKAKIKVYEDKIDALSKEYNKIINVQTKDLTDTVGIDKKTIKKRQDQAKYLLNTKKTNDRGTWEAVWNMFTKSLGLSASNPNYNPWSEPKNTNPKNDKPTNDPVTSAKNLKKDLEAQRADLTPTFDLDKLASDANKANDIVMSSLMAAQNASIGDYINTNSELNPFMKDRWQNVYNFTQNNYSPKALSRIDIYRQTQRQLSMSRGF